MNADAFPDDYSDEIDLYLRSKEVINATASIRFPERVFRQLNSLSTDPESNPAPRLHRRERAHREQHL